MINHFLIMIVLFTFQYVSILISLQIFRCRCCVLFTFQYVSILIPLKLQLDLQRNIFTFQYVSILIGAQFSLRNNFKGIYIPICFYFNFTRSHGICKNFFIYIPICFYFNPSPEFPLLFYLISPLSVDQPKFTNILPYLLH